MTRHNLRIKQTLTIKPLGLKMRAALRHGMNATDLERFLHGSITNIIDCSAVHPNATEGANPEPSFRNRHTLPKRARRLSCMDRIQELATPSLRD